MGGRPCRRNVHPLPLAVCRKLGIALRVAVALCRHVRGICRRGRTQVGCLRPGKTLCGNCDQIYHPAFGGSFSLKAVLPIVGPEMAYDGMTVENGQAPACLGIARLWRFESLGERQDQEGSAGLLRARHAGAPKALERTSASPRLIQV